MSDNIPFFLHFVSTSHCFSHCGLSKFPPIRVEGIDFFSKKCEKTWKFCKKRFILQMFFQNLSRNFFWSVLKKCGLCTGKTFKISEKISKKIRQKSVVFILENLANLQEILPILIFLFFFFFEKTPIPSTMLPCF